MVDIHVLTARRDRRCDSAHRFEAVTLTKSERKLVEQSGLLLIVRLIVIRTSERVLTDKRLLPIGTVLTQAHRHLARQNRVGPVQAKRMGLPVQLWNVDRNGRRQSLHADYSG